MKPFHIYHLLGVAVMLLMWMGCGDRTDDKSCLENKHIYDTLSHHGYTYYAGYQDYFPILMRAAGGNCSALEVIRRPLCVGGGDRFYNEFVASGDRIAVNLYEGNGDAQKADTFLLSTDDGETWHNVGIDGLAKMDEGIWKIVFHGTREIELYLFDLDGSGQFWSTDNGATWKPMPVVPSPVD